MRLHETFMGVVWEQYFVDVNDNQSNGLTFIGCLLYSKLVIWRHNLLNPHLNSVSKLISTLRPGELATPAGKLPYQICPRMPRLESPWLPLWEQMAFATHLETGHLCCMSSQMTDLEVKAVDPQRWHWINLQLFHSLFFMEKIYFHCSLYH